MSYKSRSRLFGIPVLHISRGVDPKTGKVPTAFGVIAIGRVAVGGIAVGGAAMGVLAIGGVSFGVMGLGVVAVGVLAGIGGIALSLWFALGGLAVGFYAAGAWVIDAGFLGAEAERLNFIKILDTLLSEGDDGGP